MSRFLSQLLLISIFLWQVVCIKTPISKELLKTFRRYIEISTAAYIEPCPHPPQGIKIVHQIYNRYTSTQGFIAIDEAANEVIIAFKGSEGFRDTVTDIRFFHVPLETVGVTDCNGCQVHKGFLRSWNSVANDTVEMVKGLVESHPGMKITITGHSLGGALASLATASFRSLGFAVKTYTYGQPRTGDQKYADFIDGLTRNTMFRVTHGNDFVPRVPYQFLGYHHHSTEYWQSVDEPIAAKTFKCVGQDPEDCNLSTSASAFGPNAAHSFYIGLNLTAARVDGSNIC
ncbi:hypothetical protein CP532_6747, partial [Ophiocordyceps camponoti-leonardi (nom. inval.)]